VSSSEERIGLNEALFREVNERIEELADHRQLDAQQLDLICECGNPNCAERIAMSREEYERVRSDGQLFAVAPGHETGEVERVVEKREGYDIVLKREGVPEQIAELTDPRDR
jgi:hypothetical protein